MRGLTMTAATVTALAFAGAAFAATPPHYDIKARFDLKAQTVVADVAITLSPEQAMDPTGFVISDRIKLDKVDGGPGAHTKVEPSDKPFKGVNKISFTYDRPPTKAVTLRFHYSGPVNGDDDHARIDPSEGVEIGFEDVWAPVRPNFSLMFTVDADISGIPADQVAVAQGQVSRQGDHIRIHRVFEDIDMPFAALAGLKTSKETGAEVYARNLDGVLEGAVRRHAGQVVAFYEKLYSPLPASSLPERLVVLPRVGAAYARRAYISLPDGADELKKIPGPIPDWKLVATVSHEFAHAWWWRADPLTEDHWLNESLAEYSSLRFTEAAFGKAELKERLDGKVARAKAAGPVIGHGRPSKDALYQKGPLLLFGLDDKIGRAKVDALMGEIGRHPPKTTADFLAALARIAGAQAAKDFEAELRAS